MGDAFPPSVGSGVERLKWRMVFLTWAATTRTRPLARIHLSQVCLAGLHLLRAFLLLGGILVRQLGELHARPR